MKSANHRERSVCLVKEVSQTSGSGPIIICAGVLFFDRCRVVEKRKCQVQCAGTGLVTSSSFVLTGMQAVLLIFKKGLSIINRVANATCGWLNAVFRISNYGF